MSLVRDNCCKIEHFIAKILKIFKGNVKTEGKKCVSIIMGRDTTLIRYLKSPENFLISIFVLGFILTERIDGKKLNELRRKKKTGQIFHQRHLIKKKHLIYFQ